MLILGTIDHWGSGWNLGSCARRSESKSASIEWITARIRPCSPRTAGNVFPSEEITTTDAATLLSLAMVHHSRMLPAPDWGWGRGRKHDRTYATDQAPL